MGGKRVAVLATFGAAALWGTSFSINDAGLRVVDPYTFVFLRFVIGALVALALAAATGGVEWRFAREPRIWLLGALNAAGFLGQYVGQCWTTPARTALFVNSNVFIVALLSFFLFRERLGPRKLAAIGAAFAGVLLLSVGEGQPGACGAAWYGDVIVFAGAVAWSVYILANRKAVVAPGARLLPLAAWTFAATAVCLAPFLALSPTPLRAPLPEAWPILYAGVVTTVVTYVLWSVGLRRISATASALIVLTEVPIAVAISIALARESFSATAAAGGALFFAAVAYVSVVESREADAAA